MPNFTGSLHPPPIPHRTHPSSSHPSINPFPSFQPGTSTDGASPSEDPIGPNVRSIVSFVMSILLLMFVVHATYVTSNAYSHPSVVLQSSTSNGSVEPIDLLFQTVFEKDWMMIQLYNIAN